MGTRADYYVRDGDQWEWLGSTAYDGYVSGKEEVAEASTEEIFRERVADLRNNKIEPDDGWPWPWEDSNTTDYSYVWDKKAGCVLISCFGYGYVTYGEWNAHQAAYQKMEEEYEAWQEAGGKEEDMPNSCNPEHPDYVSDEGPWGSSKEDNPCGFPNMKHIQNVIEPGQPGSGVLVITVSSK